MKNAILTLSIVLMMTACSGREKQTLNAQTAPAQQPASAISTPAIATAQELPPGHPPISPSTASASPSPQSPGRLTGRVLQTMNAGGYTYLSVDTKTGPKWAAVREAKVKKGSVVTIDIEMVANDFESKTLNRKFDAIVFGVLADRAATAAPPATTPAAPMLGSMMNPMGSPAQHMSAPAVDVKVEKAEGGKSVAEVWAARTELSEKPVVVRGKVVKFLGGIMGRNWLHLRDGSGSREKGDDDLTVTTTEVANVGDVVTVSGIVHVDKDFGAGYRYPVIIEDASLRK